MDPFIVSARKYRPAFFKDVVGQAHVTTTLQNAIAAGQLAHAFLFCGPRGVGKTTCARILAKAVNCLQLTTALEPCNVCTHCLSFNTNRSMNIYELDAASHNSVEDMRGLVEQVRYLPHLGKYKVYIIDEVHMLSNAAFNACLKTLEEPPSYALFILATTERHKVLPTILSRCQIFNFNRIACEAMVAQLQAVAKQEAITYELSALQLIAHKAEGALRDALSMFDLITAAAGKGAMITYERARDHLQVLDDDYYFQCTEAILTGHMPTLLSCYDTILKLGFQGNHFLMGLGEHFRNLLVCQDAATLPLLEVTDQVRKRYAQYASQCSIPFLLRSLALVNQCDINYKASQHQRLHVELLLIELATGHDGAGGKATSPPQTPSQPSNGGREAHTSEVTVSEVTVVETHWNTYKEQLRSRGHMALYHLMNQPITLQGQVIMLPLINPIQENLLQNLKEPLLTYLSKKLNGKNFTIRGILLQQKPSKKPYTDQEKLAYLSEKNAAIASLCTRLKLTPDRIS